MSMAAEIQAELKAVKDFEDVLNVYDLAVEFNRCNNYGYRDLVDRVKDRLFDFVKET